MATDHELTIIATCEMARSMSKDIKGMGTFFDYFVKDLPLKDRKLAHRYYVIREREIDAFLKSSESEFKSTEC